MSVPNTMRVGPFTPTVLVRKRYLIFYFLLIWASIIPLLLELWLYWQLLWSYTRPVHFYTYLPLLAFLMYVTIVFSAIFFAKILLVLVNAFHKPREGVFLRIPADKDYRYWSLRNTIKRWPVWLAHRFPFPGILDNICFKMFGVKTKISNSFHLELISSLSNQITSDFVFSIFTKFSLRIFIITLVFTTTDWYT